MEILAGALSLSFFRESDEVINRTLIRRKIILERAQQVKLSRCHVVSRLSTGLIYLIFFIDYVKGSMY